jgi:N-methylhydantoinase A
MPRHAQSLRIAIDTGGTFTDCVWIDPATRRLRMLKVFSTPADPSEAIVNAVRQILNDSHAGGDRFTLLHGTTVGTNTLLERKGARTALVTTAGFEDAIEIGRQARTKLYDFFFDRVEPLVAGDLRFGVIERTAANGEILIAPTSQQLQSVADRVTSAKPQAVAVSLLFSFANPANEQAVADALRFLSVPVSISHEILPEFREYERTSTVVINAYLQPVMQSYLQNLAGRADKLTTHRLPASGLSGTNSKLFAKAGNRQPETKSRIFVMQSSGGITALSTAAREPVRTVLSGPAGGVVGAVATARASGFDRIIAFDMGGTSTDVSLVEGEIKTANDAQIAGFPVGVPMLDIHTVGAGGGSLARFDAAGVLRVGPESAGADPGPICYGRGTQATVTDANLLLGRLQPAHFLGGDFTLDLDRTRRITEEWLKRNNSDLTLEKFAEGVIRVVNSTMEKAIRVVSIERGRDPRHFALVAFGGAGGLHACALAEALSIPQVIVPALPGALSALGILASDVVKDYSRTVLWRVAERVKNAVPYARLDRELSQLEATAVRDFRLESWPATPHFHHSADLRYCGQGYELNIPITKNLLRDFQQEHQRRYGHVHPKREVEIVTLRLRAVLKSHKVDVAKPARLRSGQAKVDRRQSSRLLVAYEGKKLPTRIYSRDELVRGRNYSGPAIITEYSATTVIPAGKRFHLDRTSNLIVKIR